MDTNKQTAAISNGAIRPGCDATGGPPATKRDVRVMRAALVGALAKPATAEQIGARFGMAPGAVLPHLVQLAKQGCLFRHGRHSFAAVRGRGASGSRVRLPSRPQPIRDAILAYLSEPRQAKEVATHIDRPVPDATGHLAAMRRLGLVVRTGYGRYERADLLADGARPAVVVRPHPVREATLECLDRPMHCDAVAVVTGRTPVRALHALRQLVRDGLAVHLGRGVYAPVRKAARTEAGAGGSVRAMAGDSGTANRKEVPCSS